MLLNGISAGKKYRMSKQILVNASHYETRVATLENGEIRQLHIEREEDRNVVGNIYKGLVKRVLPGMQAAFLELGLERTAFLYVDDIIEEPFGTDIEYIDEEDVGDSDSSDLDDEDEDLDEEGDDPDYIGPHEAKKADSADTNPKDDLKGEDEDEDSDPDPIPPTKVQSARGQGPRRPPGGGGGDRGDRGPRDMDRGVDDRDRDLDRGPARDQDRDFDRDRGPAPRDMDRGFDRDRDRGPVDRDRGPVDRDRGPDRDRGFDRDRGPRDQGPRDQDRGFDRGREDRPAIPRDDRDFDRGRDERPPRDFDRDRGGREPRGGSDSDRERERNRDRDGNPDRERGFDRDRGPARDLDRNLDRNVDRDRGPRPPREDRGGSRGGERGERAERAPRARSGGGGGGDRGPRDRNGRPPLTGRGPTSARRPGQRGGRRFTNRRPRGSVNIQDVLKEGQEILVQVAKAPIGTKGARLTTHISLPGRNLVLMPTVKHLGISRRIESDRERRRLRDLFVKKIRPKEMGFIIRTVAEGKSLRDLKADADYLIDLWDKVKADSISKRAPALIHEDLSLSMRAVRDFFTDEVDTFTIDDPEEFERIQDFIGRFMPKLKGRVKLFRGPSQLFEHYGIEAEISRALGKKVWLKSGGYLLIDQSEALTAVDVNTGRYVGSKSLEETILKTNLEAVKEISYQLRVRNVGGIIIIDLIDMENPENREKVFRALQEALIEDKAKTNILKISELGLVEMTRKRTHEDLVRYLTESCGYCDGRGYHKSKRTVCFEIFREIEKEALGASPNIVVFASSQVVGRMTKEEKQHVKKLEERFNKTIHVKTDPGFHVEQFEVFGKA